MRAEVLAALEQLASRGDQARADAVLARRHLEDVDNAHDRVAWLRKRVTLPTFTLPRIHDAMDRERLLALGEELIAAAAQRAMSQEATP